MVAYRAAVVGADHCRQNPAMYTVHGGNFLSAVSLYKAPQGIVAHVPGDITTDLISGNCCIYQLTN